MSYEPTEYVPNYEPTEAVYPNPYEAGNPYGLPSLPPPPPKKRRWGLLAAFISMFCLICILGASLLIILQMRGAQQGKLPPTSTPPATITQQPTPTANPDYTAYDLVEDFREAGAHPNIIAYNATIWSWTSDTYFISVHADSSATFTDDSACSGYCSPRDIGIWVYGDSAGAMQAYNDVLSDEQQSNASIPMMGIPNAMQQGRCILLGADGQSIYAQVVTQFCI